MYTCTCIWSYIHIYIYVYTDKYMDGPVACNLIWLNLQERKAFAHNCIMVANTLRLAPPTIIARPLRQTIAYFVGHCKQLILMQNKIWFGEAETYTRISIFTYVYIHVYIHCKRLQTKLVDVDGRSFASCEGDLKLRWPTQKLGSRSHPWLSC